MFNYSEKNLHSLAHFALEQAKKYGASDAEVDISESLGQSVNIRQQNIEQIEYQQSKSFSMTVYQGHKKGFASSTSFLENDIINTIKAALNIAQFTQEDEFASLADPNLMAKNINDLSLFHPWHLSVEDAIEIAKSCESSALKTDSRITNSEGASVSTASRQFVYANSNGFMNGFPTTRHSIACSVIAQETEQMQRDYWFTQARDKQDLLSEQQVGIQAAQRALQRLNARSLKTGQYPVIFEATVAKTILGHVISAISGGSLYRQSSFLLDSLGKQKLSSCVNLYENPHIPKALASSFFDDEGVATHPRAVIQNGIIEGYFLSSYSARKLGMTTTGNAGGAHNLILSHTTDSLDTLLTQMGTGLLVTELIGQGVNLLTGDYSRGAAGFWVENGQIAYPVEEITIAGNLNEMLMGIQAIANDSPIGQTHKVGSILMDKMTVAGNQI
ncbi:metalloprotease PmbA [Neisseria sp. Ec49-e6-T10]|uniref:metalloprotease PmbA n=1 Tax=Neisseria sp. Ec49-e6-T10 TaxID=3140744 RepID=UPI003EBC0645